MIRFILIFLMCINAVDASIYLRGGVGLGTPIKRDMMINNSERLSQIINRHPNYNIRKLASFANFNCNSVYTVLDDTLNKLRFTDLENHTSFLVAVGVNISSRIGCELQLMHFANRAILEDSEIYLDGPRKESFTYDIDSSVKGIRLLKLKSEDLNVLFYFRFPVALKDVRGFSFYVGVGPDLVYTRLEKNSNAWVGGASLVYGLEKKFSDRGVFFSECVLSKFTTADFFAQFVSILSIDNHDTYRVSIKDSMHSSCFGGLKYHV